jgi:hypothetical protein
MRSSLPGASLSDAGEKGWDDPMYRRVDAANIDTRQLAALLDLGIVPFHKNPLFRPENIQLECAAHGYRVGAYHLDLKRPALCGRALH